MENKTKQAIHAAAKTERDGLKRNPKPEPKCENCLYAGHGFVCRNKNDGTCLKDWVKGKLNGSGSHAGG